MPLSGPWPPPGPNRTCSRSLRALTNWPGNCRPAPIRRCCIICRRKVTQRHGSFCKAATRRSIAPPQDEDLDDSFYELQGIYLHPDYCQKGVGTQAIDFALSFASSIGKKSMVVWAFEESSWARRFYEKCGFAFDGMKKEFEYGKTLIGVRYRRGI